MKVRGRIQKGVVVLDPDCTPPEGAEVTVAWSDALSESKSQTGRRIQLPLVRSSHPGSVPLTSDRVAELLDEEDVSA